MPVEASVIRQFHLNATIALGHFELPGSLPHDVLDQSATVLVEHGHLLTLEENFRLDAVLDRDESMAARYRNALDRRMSNSATAPGMENESPDVRLAKDAMERFLELGEFDHPNRRRAARDLIKSRDHLPADDNRELQHQLGKDKALHRLYGEECRAVAMEAATGVPAAGPPAPAFRPIGAARGARAVRFSTAGGDMNYQLPSVQLPPLRMRASRNTYDRELPLPSILIREEAFHVPPIPAAVGPRGTFQAFDFSPGGNLQAIDPAAAINRERRILGLDASPVTSPRISEASEPAPAAARQRGVYNDRTRDPGGRE